MLNEDLSIHRIHQYNTWPRRRLQRRYLSDASKIPVVMCDKMVECWCVEFSRTVCSSTLTVTLLANFTQIFISDGKLLILGEAIISVISSYKSFPQTHVVHELQSESRLTEWNSFDLKQNLKKKKNYAISVLYLMPSLPRNIYYVTLRDLITQLRFARNAYYLAESRIATSTIVFRRWQK